jgi:hypothetical protein
MLELDALNEKRPPKKKCSHELTICCLSTEVCTGEEAQSMGGRGGGAGMGWAIPIIIRGLGQGGLTFFECPPPLGSFTHCQAQDKGHYGNVNVNTHTYILYPLCKIV